jgi:hypothetical protein
MQVDGTPLNTLAVTTPLVELWFSDARGDDMADMTGAAKRASNEDNLMERLRAIIESQRFQVFIIVIIIINAVTIGLETSPSAMAAAGGLIVALDLAALTIFIVEITAKLFVYGADFPEWFGTIGASLYTLFQIMTLESWSMGIVRPVMEVHPYAWTFFVPFILIITFAVLNLDIAIVVNSMINAAAAGHADTSNPDMQACPLNMTRHGRPHPLPEIHLNELLRHEGNGTLRMLDVVQLRLV